MSHSLHVKHHVALGLLITGVLAPEQKVISVRIKKPVLGHDSVEFSQLRLCDLELCGGLSDEANEEESLLGVIDVVVVAYHQLY